MVHVMAAWTTTNVAAVLSVYCKYFVYRFRRSTPRGVESKSWPPASSHGNDNSLVKQPEIGVAWSLVEGKI